MYNRSRERLVNLTRKHDLPLRKSYARLGPSPELKAERYLHPWQSKRVKREIRRLNAYLGRVHRDICRKLEDRPDLLNLFDEEVNKAARLMEQERTSKNKLYSLHTSGVEYNDKGKVHKKYEFGVKVSVATTNRDKFVVGILADQMGTCPKIDAKL